MTNVPRVLRNFSDDVCIFMKKVFLHIFLVVLVCCVPCSVFASDSPYLSRYGVNLATGNHFYQQVDVSFSGSGSGFGFVRHYNSQSEESGIFGYGWRFTLSDRLVFDGTAVVYVGADGSRTRLSASGDVWVNDLGRKLKLERQEGGSVAEALQLRK